MRQNSSTKVSVPQRDNFMVAEASYQYVKDIKKQEFKTYLKAEVLTNFNDQDTHAQAKKKRIFDRNFQAEMNEIITKNRAMGSNISPGLQSMKSSAYGLGGSDSQKGFQGGDSKKKNRKQIYLYQKKECLDALNQFLKTNKKAKFSLELVLGVPENELYEMIQRERERQAKGQRVQSSSFVTEQQKAQCEKLKDDKEF